jgi:hypothetical protein
MTSANLNDVPHDVWTVIVMFIIDMGDLPSLFNTSKYIRLVLISLLEKPDNFSWVEENMPKNHGMLKIFLVLVEEIYNADKQQYSINNPKSALCTLLRSILIPVRVARLLLSDDRIHPELHKDILHGAISYRQTEVIKLLLTDPRIPAKQLNEAIVSASHCGLIESLELLLADQRVYPGTPNRALESAAMYGHAKVVSLLLADKRVNPAVNDNRAIISAIHNGHTETVCLLLSDKRVDPSDNNNEAIRGGIWPVKKEIVELLRNYPGVDFGALNHKQWR